MTDSNIDTELTTALATVTVVSSRVYPQRMPQNPTFPLLTYARISTQFVQAINGTLAATGPRFQVDCWATSYSSARELAIATKTALLAFHGSAVTIYASSLEDESDMYDPETKLYHPHIDIVYLHG